jgi:hypothetical protein
VKKIRKILKKNVGKIGKIGKNRKKIQKKIRKNNLKIFNYTCIYDILPIFDQSWKKKERRR